MLYYLNSLAIDQPKPDEVEITVFGPGFGESIVIHIPVIGWGILDCCEFGASPNKVIPPLEYLIYQKVKELAFLILTHPHQDHLNGMEKVISHYEGNIKRICRYAGESVRELGGYLINQGRKGNPGAKRLSLVLDAFKKAELKGAEKRRLGARTQIIPAQEISINSKNFKVEILSLSPLAADEEIYNDILKEAWVKPGQEVIKIPDAQHNLVASAIHINVGETSLILGSDVEKGLSANSGWQGIMNSVDRSDVCAKMIKVSHHGSSSAYCREAWEEHSRDGKVISIITPYNRGAAIPTEADIQRTKRHSEYIGITTRPKYLRAVDVYDRAVARRLPEKWKTIKEEEKLGMIILRYNLEGSITYRRAIQPSFWIA